MNFIKVEICDGVAVVTLTRGKVNALNNAVVNELREQLKALEADNGIKAVVLTGSGKFFSFGFDIPEFLSFTKDEFTDYLTNFTDLYTYLFLYPKPVVAALNGHTIAGGCMLALACDHRIMAFGKGKISLNEIAFGSSVFAGSTEMLRFWIGNADAARVLYSGAMYPAEEAMGMGLVQGVASQGNLLVQAKQIALGLGSKHLPAFASIKSLLRGPIAEDMTAREGKSIKAFVDIWYSEPTWKKLQDIKIN